MLHHNHCFEERAWIRQKGGFLMQAKSRRPLIGELWNSIQTWLLPVLEDELGELDEQHRQFVSVCELCAPQDHMASSLASRSRIG